MNTAQDEVYLKQFASYIKVQDIMHYLSMHPEELEITANEDYEKGLITKEELEYELKLVEKIRLQAKEEVIEYGKN